jgi:hypothetical protein
MRILAVAIAVLLPPALAGASSKVPPYFNREIADYPFPVLKVIPEAAEGQPAKALYAGPVALDGLMIGGAMTDLTAARPKLVERLGVALEAQHFACGTVRRVVLVEPLPGLGNSYWWIKCPASRHYAVETSDVGLHHIVRAK